jgi:inorganic pyrophosphatase
MEYTVVIEDPRGSTLRHHWDENSRSWVERPHPHSNTPWPANYGYMPETWNPADEDALDVLVISTDPIETGSQVEIRVVGLLLRPDGDDKILGVLVSDPIFGSISRFQDVPSEQVLAIERWFAEWSQIGQWRDESSARARIEQALGTNG